MPAKSSRLFRSRLASFEKLESREVFDANHAPVLDTSVDVQLADSAEDVVQPPGTLVSSLTGGISDVDAGAVQGIAVSSANNFGGTWQYSLNGTNWLNFGAVSRGAVRLLPADAITRVRLVPNANFNGTASLWFFAWDQTSGSPGGTANLNPAGTTGGTTAFSTVADQALLTVTPVNDAPKLNANVAVNLDPITQDTTPAGTLVSSLVAGISDVDAGALQGIAVSNVNRYTGTWQYTLDGTNWLNFGEVSRGAVRLLPADATTRVRMIPNASYTGTTSMWFFAWDQTTGTPGATANLNPAGTTGGTTAFSTVAVQAFLDVTPVADMQIGPNDFRISHMSDGDTRFFARDSEIAYNSTDNEYLVVYRGDKTINDDFNIYAQRINAATGALLGTPDFLVSHMEPEYSEHSPAVAYNSVSNEYLVVWTAFTNADPHVFGQRLSATGAVIGDSFRMSGTTGTTGRETEPSVAFNPIRNEYLVTWRADQPSLPFLIYGQRIDGTTGGQIGANDFRISETAFNACANPRVAFSTTSNQYVVVWTGTKNKIPVGSGTTTQIYGQRIAWSPAAGWGPVATNDFRISDMGPEGSAQFSGATPDVAWNQSNNEFLVVWRGDDDRAGMVANEFEVFGQRLAGGSAAAIGENDFRISDMGADGNASFGAFMPKAVWNSVANEYVITWRGDNTVDGEFEIFGQRLSNVGAALGTNDFRGSDMGPEGNTSYEATEPAIAFNSVNNQFLIVWTGDDNVDTLVNDQYEIFGQRFAHPSAIPAPASSIATAPVVPSLASISLTTTGALLAGASRSATLASNAIAVSATDDLFTCLGEQV